MRRIITNQSCELYQTEQCDLLNMPGCKECFLNNDPSAAKQIMADMDVLKSLMPEGGVAPLFESPNCQFCRVQPAGKRACYALLDMAHAEPRREKRSIIGLKVKAKVGTLLPLQIATCADCRKRLRVLDYVPTLVPLATAIMLLLLFMLPALNDALARIHLIMPLVIFVAVELLSVLVAQILKGRLEKKYSEVMRLDPFEISTVGAMKAKGWFVLSGSDKRPKMLFSRRRMRMGVGTGGPEDANAVKSL